MQRVAAAIAMTMMLSLSCSVAAATEEMASGLQAANDAEVRAFLAADAKGLSSLWDDTFVVNNPLGKFVTGPPVAAMVTVGVLRFTSLTRSIDYTHAYGDITILAGTENCGWAGKFSLAGQTSKVRFIAVWRHLYNGKWLEVARHADIVPDR
ncbi:nuclear transport factor 2 family protein (plasmid) [Polymorphobacter sp. PAMC 29334]|uniref:nuclear transport factor 2 family protein n=1 Tax=Polymorphobacter sp. PAMC 29334 TaxID=2862331 RepID=UPI001C66404E|nr:nuclear transport factor 2 family protein [Polymorphobacter sp. PAMC 29334]QYE33370.1 nuclear transport factor 2 family protein [Polymorphobacter sp. PAMC 29334]